MWLIVFNFQLFNCIFTRCQKPLISPENHFIPQKTLSLKQWCRHRTSYKPHGYLILAQSERRDVSFKEVGSAPAGTVRNVRQGALAPAFAVRRDTWGLSARQAQSPSACSASKAKANPPCHLENLYTQIDHLVAVGYADAYEHEYMQIISPGPELHTWSFQMQPHLCVNAPKI